MNPDQNLVTLCCGHQMNVEAYNQKLNHFGDVLTMDGAELRYKDKPKQSYDYGYILANFRGITKEMQTRLIQANLKARVVELLPSFAVVNLMDASNYSKS